MVKSIKLLIFCLFGMIFFYSSVMAEEIKIATASNFRNTMVKLIDAFPKSNNSNAKLILISASTTQLYAQIMQGADYDLFFSADQHYPSLLIDKGFAVKDTSFTYAKGSLILAGKGAEQVENEETLWQLILNQKEDFRFAIANPRFAPYGVAAEAFLSNSMKGELSLLQKISPNLVYGNNIAQSAQFLFTKNVDLALIAAAFHPDLEKAGIEVSKLGINPLIIQDAVLLSGAKESMVAKNFLEFTKSEIARKIILQDGYQ